VRQAAADRCHCTSAPGASQTSSIEEKDSVMEDGYGEQTRGAAAAGHRCGCGRCRGIDPYTLMVAHGSRNWMWLSPQDDGLRSTTEFSVHRELQVVLDIV
jgi:hypothetical protein